MSVKAYKVEKFAKEPSFKPNNLLECLFEDADVWFAAQEYEEYFVWITKKDLEELNNLLEEYRAGEYDGDEDEEEEIDEDEIEFDEEDIEESRRVLEIIRKDLADKKSVMYIVW